MIARACTRGPISTRGCVCVDCAAAVRNAIASMEERRALDAAARCECCERSGHAVAHCPELHSDDDAGYDASDPHTYGLELR